MPPLTKTKRPGPWPADAEELFAPEVPGPQAIDAPRLAVGRTETHRTRSDHASESTPNLDQQPLWHQPEIAVTTPIRPTAAGSLERRAARRIRATWLWGLFGFATGVVFWHLIGFWGFVSETLLPTVPANRRTETSQVPEQTHRNSLVLPVRTTKRRGDRIAASPAMTNPDAWSATVDDTATEGDVAASLKSGN